MRKRYFVRYVIACSGVVAFLHLGPSTARADFPAPREQTAAFEVEFMSGMVDHHTMAIEMADLCVRRATHEPLVELCREIIESQREEVNSMRAWLKRWYRVSHEPTVDPADMSMLAELAALSGPEFEVAFMQMMIEHHRKAILDATECVDEAYHDELDSVCHNIIGTQKKEIRLMGRWLRKWYGV